jgi:sec-independent protein translocase protein TatB
MFDISWTEFLLIGVVALIFIGPKELPAVLRTLGQWTRRIRSMAADFQNQFQEAMREAEMADLKKQVDDIKSYDPLKDVRADVEAAGKDIQSSLEKPAESAAETATAQSETPALTDATGTATGPVAPEAVAELAAPAEPAATAPAADYSREAAVVAAAIAPVVPEAVANGSKPDTAGHDPEARETAGRQTAGPGE